MSSDFLATVYGCGSRASSSQCPVGVVFAANIGLCAGLEKLPLTLHVVEKRLYLHEFDPLEQIGKRAILSRKSGFVHRSSPSCLAVCSQSA